MIDLDLLTGKSSAHLVPFQESKFLVHHEMNQALENLFKAGQDAGFDLRLASSFRSYEAQKTIWNEKIQGIRPILDSNSIPIDITTKTPTEIVFSIMRWTALPGGSRHHWGSDFDLFDERAKPNDYKLQLIPSEYLNGGMFEQSTLWLNENMEKFGFFRPYDQDRGGIASEPWHLSYRPLSQVLMKKYTLEQFLLHLDQSDFMFIKNVILNAEEIYHRFIKLD